MRSLAALGVGPLRFANSGLAVDDSGAVVTIRLEDGTDLIALVPGPPSLPVRTQAC
jgi:hypothetical protein